MSTAARRRVAGPLLTPALASVLALACLGVSGCASDLPVEPVQPTASGARETQARLRLYANVAATPVRTLVVEVTAADIRVPLVFNVEASDGFARAALVLPAGSDRTVTLRGYEATGIETHRGARTLSVREGTNPTVPITLYPVAGDQPIAATLGSVSVEVRPVAYRLAAGDTVRLTATVVGSGGETLPGPVRWAALDPARAAVDPHGLVTATGVGEAHVVATYGGTAGAARVLVAAAGTTACLGAVDPVRLRWGEVFQTAGAAAQTLCVSGGAEGAEFTLVPFHAAEAGSLAVEVAGDGIDDVVGPPNPSRMPRALTAARHSAPPSAPPFGTVPRSPQGLNATRATGVTRSMAAVTPAVGNLVSYNTARSCSRPVMRTGRVVAVTPTAVVVADTANPRDGFTDAEYQAIGAGVDTVVSPVATENFGALTDLDQNGRLVVFYTRAVNEANGNGGFYWREDVRPTSACSGSNYAEIVYLRVPDPTGEINGTVFTKSHVQARANRTTAHYVQHVTNAARRAHVHNAPFEASWLDEGLSKVAEELVFYREGGLTPNRQIDAPALQAPRRVADAYTYDLRGNLDDLAQHLRTPEGSSPYNPTDNAARRGATWQFLRYAADRRAGAQAEFWRQLVNSRDTSLANLRGALGTDALGWVRDWAVAVYTDDVVYGTPSRFAQPSYDFRSILPAQVAERRFPLAARQLTAATPTAVTLTGGGAAYVRFRVPPGGVARLRVTSAGAPPPGSLSVSVVRTR